MDEMLGIRERLTSAFFRGRNDKPALPSSGCHPYHCPCQHDRLRFHRHSVLHSRAAAHHRRVETGMFQLEDSIVTHLTLYTRRPCHRTAALGLMKPFAYQGMDCRSDDVQVVLERIPSLADHESC
jgi:hypothetical protein